MQMLRFQATLNNYTLFTTAWGSTVQRERMVASSWQHCLCFYAFQRRVAQQ